VTRESNWSLAICLLSFRGFDIANLTTFAKKYPYIMAEYRYSLMGE